MDSRVQCCAPMDGPDLLCEAAHWMSALEAALEAAVAVAVAVAVVDYCCCCGVQAGQGNFGSHDAESGSCSRLHSARHCPPGTI